MPTGASDCPDSSSDLWEIATDSGRCTAKLASACQLIGLNTYTSGDAEYSKCDYSSGCPFVSDKLFKLTDGVCTPVKAIAC